MRAGVHRAGARRGALKLVALRAARLEVEEPEGGEQECERGEGADDDACDGASGEIW